MNKRLECGIVAAICLVEKIIQRHRAQNMTLLDKYFLYMLPAFFVHIADRHQIGQDHFDRLISFKQQVNITLSIGIAVMQPGDDVEQLLRKADLALYEAKQTGRNKVCIWSSTSATNNPATLPSDH